MLENVAGNRTKVKQTKLSKTQQENSKNVLPLCYHSLTRDEPRSRMLVACWEAWRVERGRFYQQFGERSAGAEAGSARQFVTDLIQRQRLHIGDIGQYYDSWVS